MSQLHTQGPWEVVGDYGDERNHPDLAIESPFGQVATVMAENCDGDAQVIADARLLAAAPDMEKALAHILVLVQQGVDDADLEAIESHCRDALGRAWNVPADEVGTPILADFP